MPRGVYPRTANQLRVAKINLAKGREPKARARAAKKLRALGRNWEWRLKVSAATKKAMHRTEVRQRHLKGLQKALEIHGVNFRGGNGQEPTATVKAWAKRLEPLGFVRELGIKTRGQTTGLRAPEVYKVDFGQLEEKIAVELDGACHRPLAQKAKDEKKTAVLESLGWKVIRIEHT